MPVKIRLTRMGKKKQPSYRVVVMDSRKPRDGAYIEQIGRYDPRQDPSLVEIDNDRALDWLSKGAQPTERVRKLLEVSGAWSRFRIGRGEIHTVGVSGSQATDDATLEPDAAVEPDVVAGEEPPADDENAEVDPSAEEVAVAVEEAGEQDD